MADVQGFKSRFKIIIFVIFFFFSSFILSANVSAEEIVPSGDATSVTMHDKEILILQSYARDYVHVKMLEAGVEQFFAASNYDVRLRYEYLDTKNFKSESYFHDLADEYELKYNEEQFDAIILCDDDALLFYEEFGERIWPNSGTIVATGINSVSRYPYGRKGITLIEERFEYTKNIELALSINKNVNVKSLNFIYDDTTTSNVIRSDLEALTKANYSDYEVNHYHDKTPEELKNIIDNATDEDIFFYVIYFHARDGRTFSYEEVPKYLVENSPVPIYGFTDFYMNTGILGGYMISSSSYGERAARTVVDLWEGKEVRPVIYEDGSNAKLIFDKNILDTYNIKNIPDNAMIINLPQDYFQENKKIILIFSGIIASLMAIILLLSWALKEKNSVQKKNEEINRLNLNFIEIQKDIVLRLGEVIETRSNETANHVKRVAQISKVLAESYGLTPEEVYILVMISPMHDVGKIGISENILNKPGKLTEEEFQIVKQHSQIGYEILKSSENEILRNAALLSQEHHERFDGTGYPLGKKGEEIHIFSRITSVADVYDALRSVRVYKSAWSCEDTEAYLWEQRGKAFDPDIIDLFFKNKEIIRNIFDELS